MSSRKKALRPNTVLPFYALYTILLIGYLIIAKGEEDLVSETKNANSPRDLARNKMLYVIAVVANFTILAWFTLAFFRKEFDFRDVDLGVIIIALGINAAYAGHRKTLKARGECKPDKNRKGQALIAIILGYYLITLTLWMVKFDTNVLGMDLELPNHFYEFAQGIVGIFAGAEIMDLLLGRLFPSNNKNNNNNDATQNNKVNNKPC